MLLLLLLLLYDEKQRYEKQWTCSVSKVVIVDFIRINKIMASLNVYTLTSVMLCKRNAHTHTHLLFSLTNNHIPAWYSSNVTDHKNSEWENTERGQASGSENGSVSVNICIGMSAIHPKTRNVKQRGARERKKIGKNEKQLHCVIFALWPHYTKC